MTDLEVLHLQQGRAITDAGLAHLEGLTKLKTLNLWYCEQVTDEGMKHLSGLKNLENLSLGHTQVSSEGIAELQARFSNCKIER